MGLPVLILGKSGSGKSASLRNFKPDEVVIYNVASKPLPFKGGKNYKIANKATYPMITNNLAKRTVKTYVIDDSQYLLAFDSFQHAKEIGYGKFTNMAVAFFNLIQYVIQVLPDDVIVYFLHHVEETETGQIKAKTIGKMIDQQLTLEGLFSIVLLTVIEEGKHYFITQSDGMTSAKSPMDMFEMKIDNDLKMVDTTIREYYEFNKEDTK